MFPQKEFVQVSCEMKNDWKSVFQPVSGWQTHFHYYPAKNLPLMSKAKESEHSKKDRSGRR